jgi:hypothetical protein
MSWGVGVGVGVGVGGIQRGNMLSIVCRSFISSEDQNTSWGRVV